MSDNIIKARFGGRPFPQIAEMQEAIWSALMQFEGEVPTMAAIGVLRLIEHRLIGEALEP